MWIPSLGRNQKVESHEKLKIVNVKKPVFAVFSDLEIFLKILKYMHMNA